MPDVARAAAAVALAMLLALAAAGRADAEATNEDCFDCHGLEAAKEEEHPGIVAEEDYAASGHSDLECVHCHTDATDIPHEDDLKAVSLESCTDCHEDEIEAYQAGSHAKARERGVKAAPDCAGCHGNLHKVVGHAQEDIPERWSGIADTCARCHADPDLAKELELSYVRPVEAYLQSAHARAIEAGKHGAVCSDCHEPHRTLPANDPQSSIWPATVPQTCGECHKEVLEKFEKSVHGKALARGDTDAPTCTDCHGEHRILSPTDADSPVFVANVPSETCGRCHGDTRLVERHGLDQKNFDAFQDSFHGLAIRAGDVKAANCSSCHGIHDVLAADDPASSIHPDNIGRTCAECHPGAGERFAVGPVHVSAALDETRIEYWVRLLYLWLIAGVLGFMVIHNAADYARKFSSKHRHHAAPEGPVPVRMPRVLRWQHRLVMISFPILGYTGFALTSPESWWAAPFMELETSWGTRGWTHRVAAIVLIIATGWHVGGLIWSKRQRLMMSGMMWGMADLRYFLSMMAYYLHLRAEPPTNGKFSYIEKAEYWAFMWGTVLMAVTGLPLWFADITLRWTPKWFTDVATAIHFYEAILASGAIAIWHLYWVIFDPDVYPMDTSWWTGHAPPARNAERAGVPPCDLAPTAPTSAPSAEPTAKDEEAA